MLDSVDNEWIVLQGFTDNCSLFSYLHFTHNPNYTLALLKLRSIIALYYHYSFFRSCLQRHTCWDLNFLKMPVYGLWESFSRTICDDGTKTQFGFWRLRMFCVFRLSAEKTNLFMRSHQDSSQSMLLQKMSQSSSSRKWKVNLLVWKCSSLFPRSQSCW